MQWAIWLAVGVLLGVGVSLALSALRNRPERASSAEDELFGGDPEVPAGASELLTVLRTMGVILDRSDAVVDSSPSARARGLVRGRELRHEGIVELVRAVRRDRVVREVEMEISPGRWQRVGEPRQQDPPAVRHLGVRVAPLGTHFILVLVDDHTHARRVEEVRRDFVVNVSHELKTPVGGLALLAEAVTDAADDPEAVRRFAGRMNRETERLANLVKEVVDLSRLQAADTIADPQLVDMRQCALDAIDHTHVVASAKNIDIVTSGIDSDDALLVYGAPDLLTTAVRNLLTNAVAYSMDSTKVVVRVRARHDMVEVAVIDQGQGIPAAEQQRVFERFYRVDAARSRSTGGTGLGLAIVKHICANHGGDVTVWSEEGRGSTFTLRLPAADATADSPQAEGAKAVSSLAHEGASMEQGAAGQSPSSSSQRGVRT